MVDLSVIYMQIVEKYLLINLRISFIISIFIG